MKKKILIGLIVFCAIIAVYTIKSEATFKITNFTINCIVNENGDMQIEENINYYTTENKYGLLYTISRKIGSGFRKFPGFYSCDFFENGVQW